MSLPVSPTLDALLDGPPGLLDMTFDQLRTLLVVHETGSALRAARVLGREQSSVQKQLDTLNRTSQTLCGEVLTVRQGRGRDFLFTPTGEATVELARGTFEKWLESIHLSRRRLGRMLTVGTTEFTLPIVSRAWNRVSEEFRQREVEFKVLHVRTKDVWSRLENRQVDLICGSIVSTQEGDLRLKEYEVIEYARGQALLLTNLPESELPDAAVETSGLGRVPLVVPPAGLVADLLATWYGTNFRERLNVVADIDDVHYGLSLLRSGFVRGCMIVTGSIGRGMAAQEDSDAVPLRTIGLHDDLEPKAELMTGAFVRRADLERYDAGHPLNRLWDAVKEDVRTYTPLA
ncbi:LysR family transcriptional regulator [Actinomadura madurae]|uniref:DNA-binding transcriptional regulator, LysR family n=1 Tax=Actinomadura madurae TaxID=1993 RepID=A0A1I5VRW1_9ACTN|nr:LysR family transcriptional regulator [Actinomadura madurae]MCP9949405.1 LysR family transcriptional regulator [Actinomadura madurae]MCP9966161.1 LysR family transcriptional regulator [Actinomadura madurae]MCP9978651.1 LysR family transcriptional regulator [Actinomadura madurae]MCQ0009829.1 LysR family transcriptional regulator [Actinomadura madurae]MCQ0014847.1 LysR family transcriptional regulator [Actinomadura madurae]